MNELHIIKRKIELARQGLILSRVEIEELELKYTLLKAKSRLEHQIDGEFDSVLSRRLDCIIYLLEN